MLVILWDNVPDKLRNAGLQLHFRPSRKYQ